MQISIAACLVVDSSGIITMSVGLFGISVHIPSLLIQNRVAPSVYGLGVPEMAASLQDNGEFFIFFLDGLSACLTKKAERAYYFGIRMERGHAGHLDHGTFVILEKSSIGVY